MSEDYLNFTVRRKNTLKNANKNKKLGKRDIVQNRETFSSFRFLYLNVTAFVISISSFFPALSLNPVINKILEN